MRSIPFVSIDNEQKGCEKMLVNMVPILKDAQSKGYGVAAPNIFDGYTIEAAFKCAETLHAPMILDVNGELDKLKYMAELTNFFSVKYDRVPVALNLDHGQNYENIMCALHAGFTSVMIDKSSESFEENVRQTKEVVEAAHAVGVSVEAELGHVGKGLQYETDGSENLTTPEDVAEFVEKTKVDALAVAVGTAYGHYIGEPHIDFERLKEIRAVSNIPLVLHGGSSTGDENLRKAVSYGIGKINIGTDLGDAGLAQLKAFLTDYDPHKRGVIEDAFKAAAEGFENKLKHYMEILGERNRW